jgi:hypothetical protein
MLNAITSMISKTIDIFLKVNSAESRRRKLSKNLFEVYKALDEIVGSLEDIETTIRRITKLDDKSIWSFDRGGLPEYVVVRSWSSAGTIQIQTLYLDEHGSEKLSPIREMKQEEILPLLLSTNIRTLNQALGRLSRIMSAESWNLWNAQHKPEMLKALEIYDKTVVNTFIRAWFEDGGFIEALYDLGLYQEVDGNLRVLDATFDPYTSPHGYAVEYEETRYDLANPDDVDSFLKKTASCKRIVAEARDTVKKFIGENCKIEDIL